MLCTRKHAHRVEPIYEQSGVSHADEQYNRARDESSSERECHGMVSLNILPHVNDIMNSTAAPRDFGKSYFDMRV